MQNEPKTMCCGKCRTTPGLCRNVSCDCHKEPTMCCEKCRDWNSLEGKFCENPNCPCHQPQKSTCIYSDHKYGEDKTCKTCYPEAQSLQEILDSVDCLIERGAILCGIKNCGDASCAGETIRRLVTQAYQSAEATAYKKGMEDRDKEIKKLVEAKRKGQDHQRSNLYRVECNGRIWNDWTGKKMTKKQAKKYVLNY